MGFIEPLVEQSCIEDNLLRFLEDGVWKEDSLELDLPDRLLVLGNRHLITLLINNCLGTRRRSVSTLCRRRGG